MRRDEKCVTSIPLSFDLIWNPIMGGILTVCKFRVAVLSEMLDASDIMGVIDMQKLRLIASSGMSVAYCIFLRIRWDC